MVVEDRKRRIRRTDIVGKSSITDNRNSRFDILHGISEEGDNIDAGSSKYKVVGRARNSSKESSPLETNVVAMIPDQVSYVSSTVIPGSNAMHRAVTILEEGEVNVCASPTRHQPIIIDGANTGVESSDNLGPPVVVVDEGHDGILEMEHSGKKHGPSLVEA
ncbi:hypothetical protein V6N11_008423 [Hibiscus sabdariffa]|uniref:Uncharacterized protein n=1 Tax=Hibiscus sabdariffa TaxID=183260 RepID=A0ABR2P887_9ROSI